MVHLTVGIDEAGHRMTEKIWDKTWMSRLMQETYVTMGGDPLPDGGTRAFLFATWRPGTPVLSRLLRPLFVTVMKRLVRKDMDGLKAFCEDAASSAHEPGGNEAGD
jgi:hypothetical protein